MPDKIIRTVSGDIAAETLGYCQCHEHLFIAKGISGEKIPSLIIDDYTKTKEELQLYFGEGGRAVVDAQPVGCGRMTKELQNVSRETAVHIIASTGFHKLDFYESDHYIFKMEQEELEKLFIDELNEGMYTDCVNGPQAPVIQGSAKAGIIKSASDGRDIRLVDDRLPIYKRLFSAAGAAARKTGAPVLTHLEMGKGAQSQLEVLTSQGIAPDRIIMSHIDRVLDSSNIEYRLAAAESGVYLQLDTIGRFKYHSDEEEAAFIRLLCEKGYQDKILLGLDTTRERLKSYGGTIGLNYIMNNFRSLLTAFGIDDDLFHQFTVENPKRALCFEKNNI